MPHPNPKGRHAPTAGRPHMHPHTTLLSSTNHSGGENYQGSRGSTAQRSLRKPLPLAFSWIWSCEDQKTPRLPARMGKLHAANLSTWRVPRNSGNCRKTARRTETMAKPTKTRKNTGQEPNAVRRQGEQDQEKRRRHHEHEKVPSESNSKRPQPQRHGRALGITAQLWCVIPSLPKHRDRACLTSVLGRPRSAPTE